MFQQSVDRSHGSQRADLLLFLGLIIAFFASGAAALYLEKLFSSQAPRYIFIMLVLIALYIVYRLRIVGFRYTVFYKAPEPVYDPRFDDMMLHEDYPYPVGTVVFERIISAKGVILCDIHAKDIVAFLRPGEAAPEYSSSKLLFNAACRKPEASCTLFFKKDGGLMHIYFDPNDEFISYLNIIINEVDKAE